MNAADSILNTKKRYLIIRCTWNIWNSLSNKDAAYKIKKTLEDLDGLRNVSVTIYDDENEEYLEVQ